MSYTLTAPNRVALVLLGIVASLENELPEVRTRRIAQSVQLAHSVARGLLPDLSRYADTVARQARITLLQAGRPADRSSSVSELSEIVHEP